MYLVLCVSLLPWYDARPRVCQFLFDFWSKIISCSMRWKMKCFLFVVLVVLQLCLLSYGILPSTNLDHADNCYKSLNVFFLLLFSLIVTKKFDRLYTFRAMKNEHLHLSVWLGHNHLLNCSVCIIFVLKNGAWGWAEAKKLRLLEKNILPVSCLTCYAK